MYKALIVDDEAAEREGLAYLFHRLALPFEVQLACNGKEALKVLSTYAADCLVTDIKMPFMDGLALCAEAQRLHPSLVMIIFSAYNDFALAKQAIQLHVADYVLKPVVVENFAEVMQRVVQTLDDRRQREAWRQELLNTYKEANWLQKDKIISVLLREESDAQEEFAQDLSVTRAVALALDCIEQNYEQDIGLDWVASNIYLSPGYLSSLFKQETGKSVIQYITLCRLEKAKQLLTETNMRISEISRRVGIGSASYFCLLFRKHYGITAQQMREEVYRDAKRPQETKEAD